MAAVADLQVDDLTLDLATRMARRGKHVLPRLTALEGRLLHVLLRHRGQTLPAETLIERVWGYTGAGDRNMLRKLVNRLRAKIEPDPRQPRYIITVRGIGYRFKTSERREG
jgi:DNA-binding response OmpR family regulator